MSLVFVPFYNYALPVEYQDLLSNLTANHKSFLRACMTVLDASELRLRQGFDFERLNAIFSCFSLTGIPVCEASTVFTAPPVSPWKSKRLTGSKELAESDVMSFFLGVTQRRNLAKLAISTEQEVEHWSSGVSFFFFDRVARLLGKITHDKASLTEKEHGYLGHALVVLLFMSEIRSTHVLQAAERTLKARDVRLGTDSLINSMRVLARYVFGLSEKRKHLRLWAQHWLRKLYGSTQGIRRLLPVVVGCILLSSMDLGSPSLLSFEGGPSTGNKEGAVGEVAVDKTERDGGGNRAENAPQENNLEKPSNEQGEGEGSGENDLAPLQLGSVHEVLRQVARDIGPSDSESLHAELDLLVCKDLVGLFSPRPPPSSVETADLRLRRDIVLEHSRRVPTSKPGNLEKGVGGNLEDPSSLLFSSLVAKWIGMP